jgi:alkylation response protein AidB-like acyl-CoA dehydrogenase
MTATVAALDSTAIFGRAEELAGRFAGRAAAHDRDGSFPFENFDELEAAGLLSLTVPRRFGGDGAGLTVTCGVIERVAHGDPSTALVLAMQYIYHALAERRGEWPAAVHERLCRESVAGRALINVLRVEPELGTPGRGGVPATVAERTATGWRLAGHKTYATGFPVLRYLLVYAAAGGFGETAHAGHFLVPAGAAGVRVVETWDHAGMRATRSDDVYFDGVELPEDAALDLKPLGPPRPDPAFAAWNGLVISSVYLGVARAARDWLVLYLHERQPSNLGASLATLPRFQVAVGEIEALLYTAGRLIDGLARDVDGGAPVPAGSAGLVKYTATANARRAVEIGLELTGNPGLSRANPLERHYRDVLCARIHVPQDDMILTAAGKLALGLT